MNIHADLLGCCIISAIVEAPLIIVVMVQDAFSYLFILYNFAVSVAKEANNAWACYAELRAHLER